MKRIVIVFSLLTGSCVAPAAYDQTYLRSSDNWHFRSAYPQADHLFNAFDYGHAILYETLLRFPGDAPRRLEGAEFAFITKRLLPSPPAVPLDEHAIAPRYSSVIPEAIETFDWAHQLHRQLYDILSDDRLSAKQQSARIAAAIRYYRTRKDIALSSAPKTMTLMEGQPYSLAFRREAPVFNHLIWSYHWLQMGLYDAILSGTGERREYAINATIRRFFELTAESRDVPSMMPMSAAIAPRFSERYPEAAIIFDNLHSLHDVVSDILASKTVAPRDKRGAVLRALATYRDSTTEVTSRADWKSMSKEMGVEHMGGSIPPR